MGDQQSTGNSTTSLLETVRDGQQPIGTFEDLAALNEDLAVVNVTKLLPIINEIKTCKSYSRLQSENQRSAEEEPSHTLSNTSYQNEDLIEEDCSCNDSSLLETVSSPSKVSHQTPMHHNSAQEKAILVEEMDTLKTAEMMSELAGSLGPDKSTVMSLDLSSKLRSHWSEGPKQSCMRTFFETVHLPGERMLLRIRSFKIDADLMIVTMYILNEVYLAPVRFCDEEDLVEAIIRFVSIPLCAGIPQKMFESLPNLIRYATAYGGLLRSHECNQLVLPGLSFCRPCQRLKTFLNTKIIKYSSRKKAYSKKEVEEMHAKLHNDFLRDRNQERAALQLLVKRAQIKIVELEQELIRLREKTAELDDKVYLQDIDSLDDKAKLTVRALLRSAKCKTRKGMRYEAEWLLECLLLRIKSTAAYEHLRRSQLIPLPCGKTLNRLLKGMSCHLGFNVTALNAVREAMNAAKEPRDKLVVLSLDEMSIQQAVTYNVETLAFEGFVMIEDDPAFANQEKCQRENTEQNRSYHEEPSLSPDEISHQTSKDPEDIETVDLTQWHLFEDEADQTQDDEVTEANVETESENEERNVLLQDHDETVAYHALVFMCRALTNNWVQPFGVFACKGAAPKDSLFKLLISAIVRLHFAGANVIAVVNDGAQNNKGMWQLCGVSVTQEEVVNFMKHPILPESKIFFFADPPNVFKCIRNNMWSHDNLQANGKIIRPQYLVKRLFEKDDVPGGVRACPKLRRVHVFPTTFQRMSVRYAVQIFSNSVVAALKYYKELEEKEAKNLKYFADSENVIEIFQLLNDPFDIMNARIPKQGISKNNWANPNKEKDHRRTLLQFDKYLVETWRCSKLPQFKDFPMFLSLVTLKSTRVTIKSMIDLTDLLLSKYGFHYVLSGKFNQDCLERFFGIIRASGGAHNKPTVSSFLQLFRLLSLYYPTKHVLRGANVDSEEKTTILENYANSLKKRVEEHQASKTKLKEYINNQLIDQLQLEFETDGPQPASAPRESNIVYNIAGYLVNRILRRRKMCDLCKKSLNIHPDFLSEEFPMTRFTELKTREGITIRISTFLPSPEQP